MTNNIIFFNQVLCIKTKDSIFAFAILSIVIWPLRLVVRTPGFHPGNRSSILLGAANPFYFRVGFLL